MPRSFLLAALALLALTAFAQNDPPPETRFGTIIDAVVCEEDPSQSYTLYVPSYYTPERKWPVIYCFDPGARGIRPVQKLELAAEKFGYIVAGSLTSKNGPWADNHAAARALSRDVSRHFSIDPARTYTAGLSGGARVATALALSGFSKGVIGCGAGFPVLPQGLPEKIAFPYHGIVGYGDFNYGEMVALTRDLSKRGSIHRLTIFDGGHEWPPEDVFLSAVEWFELRSMRDGALALDPEFVSAAFVKRQASCQAVQLARRADAQAALLRDFPERSHALQAELEALLNSEAYRKDSRHEEELLLREASLVSETAAAALEPSKERQRYASRLRNRADAAVEKSERQMYQRVMTGFLSISRETVRGLLETGDYEKAASLLDMANALRPGHARTLYDLATTRAYLKDRKVAFATLGEAITAGFADLARAQEDPAWEAYKSDPEFQRIIERGKNVDSDGIVMLSPMRISAALESVELRLFYLPHNQANDTPALSFLRVETVRAGTTAALAGVVVGLEVTAIDGARIRGLSESELRDVMNRVIRGELRIKVREHARARERELKIPLKPAPNS